MILVCVALWQCIAGAAAATEFVTLDGRVLRGKPGKVTSMSSTPGAANPNTGPREIAVFVDDELRRTYFGIHQYRQQRQETVEIEEKFKVWQKVMRAGPKVQSVGPVLKTDPFDDFGRRIFVFGTAKGPASVVHGITEVTPQYAKVEGISHVWDMRIATSSIPRETLHKILLRQIDPKNIEHHQKIARFYNQCERYEEARDQLESIFKLFPDQPGLKKGLEPSIRALQQLASQRLLSELRLRYQSGQHRMVFEKLQKFPTENTAGEILQAVREMIEEYQGQEARRADVLRRYAELLSQISETSLRAQLEAIGKEIAAELDPSTLGRMATFRQNVDDKDLLPGEKLALAVSGWLLGADEATVKLPVALSLYKTRGLLREYLAEPVKMNREAILDILVKEEAAAPPLAAGLLRQMKPPLEVPPPLDAKTPGYYRLEVVGLASEAKVPYLVQLPPEYNPYRRYPTIVTLHGAGNTAESQVDWWAGAWTSSGLRTGQASRHGYIVIAPQWTAEHQKQYNYSAREHAAVLNSLRDACRRFAIDTDRVFLSGHSLGGDAAWDIGLAHPDLWAGVIVVEGQSERFCNLYWKNAKHVPFYVVLGELDGGKLARNATDLDRYFKGNFNLTVVEYRGRGPEHFYDEILRLFDWMGRCRRSFFPRTFDAFTLRQFDNFFWWVELSGMPSKAVINPANWPPPRGTLAVPVHGEITNANGLVISTGTGEMSVWVSPEMLDFKQRVTITVNGHRVNTGDRFLEPDLRTLLEDVRTRGDRQHPFWVKLDVPTGRVLGGR